MGRGTQIHLFPKNDYTSNSGNKTTTKKRDKVSWLFVQEIHANLILWYSCPMYVCILDKFGSLFNSCYSKTCISSLQHHEKQNQDPTLLLPTLMFSSWEEHFHSKTCFFLSRPHNSPVFLSLALTWDQMTRRTKTCALIQRCPHLPPLPVHTRCTNSHPPVQKQGHGLPRHHLEHQGWLAQPFTSSWEPGSLTATHCKNHNIMKSRTTVKGTQQPHITLEMDVNCGSKSTYNFYAMSSSFCILARLIPEGIREVHPGLQRATYK